MSFRLKTILGIALIEAILLAFLIHSSLDLLRRSNEEALITHAETTAKLFATMTADAVIATDLAALESFIDQVLTNSEMIYARIRDGNELVLVQGGDEALLRKPFLRDTDLADDVDDVFDTEATITIADTVYGKVELGFATAQLKTLFADAQQKTATIAGIEMVLVALFSLILGFYLTRQLNGLKTAADHIANGELGYQIEIKGKDELARVAQAFNNMSQILHEQDLRRRAIFNSALDAIVVINHEGQITEFNPAAEKIFGWLSQDIVGKKLADTLIPAAQRQIHKQGFERYLTTGEKRVIDNRVELIAAHAEDKEFPIELTVTTVTVDKQPIFIGFVRDITARKLNERMLEERNLALERSNRELQDFAYIASHDLQEPLRKIQAFGDRLVTKYAAGLDVRGQDYLERMCNAASRMQALINDLLDFARVTTAEEPFVEVDLNKIANEVISDLDTIILENQALIKIAKLPKIEADPTQMRQVIQNLIGNALKYRKEDKPPIVELFGAFDDDASHYQLHVKDNGIGFDNKYAQRIFGVFERLHGRNEKTGTGVGLAIVRKIAERHGGEVSAKSAVNEGTIVSITLPVKQLQNQESSKAA